VTTCDAAPKGSSLELLEFGRLRGDGEGVEPFRVNGVEVSGIAESRTGRRAVGGSGGSPHW
jgi:hypothetical protein